MRTDMLLVIGKLIIGLSIITLTFTGYKIVSFEDNLKNVSYDNASNIITQVLEYETDITYDSSIPSNITKTLSLGKNGISYIDASGTVQTIKEVENEQILVGTGKNGYYEGIMTGYGYDCVGCDMRGYTACDTKEEGWYNLLTDGIYYDDPEFGSARVLAAALQEFPCGTIVEVESSNLGNFTGIVLDTGSDMRKFYNMGIYHFDVAFETENDPMVPYATNMDKVVYNVQRWGF